MKQKGKILIKTNIKTSINRHTKKQKEIIEQSAINKLFD